MRHEHPKHTPTLETVQQQFETWRSGKTGRELIPDHLWAAAVRLCRDHPLTRVSRVLRLSFHDLKKRLPGTSPVRFMELDCSAIAGPWQLECRRSDGSQLRVTSTGPLPDLTRLLQDFLT